MITCPKCSKDNQDHYKFCLGCGAELPRDAAPKPFSPQTPPQGVKAAAGRAARRAAPRPRRRRSAAHVRGDARRRASARGSRRRAPARRRAAPPPPASAAPSRSPRGRAAAVAPAGDRRVPAVRPHQRAEQPVLRLVRLPPRRRGARPAPAAPAPAAGRGGRAARRRPHRAPRRRQRGRHLPAPDGGTVTVGRETGGIFAGDSYLSPRHATFRAAGRPRHASRTRARSTASTRSSRATCRSSSSPNDVFRIGQEIIKFEPLAHAAAVAGRRRAPRRAAQGLRRAHRARHRPRRRRATRSPSRRRGVHLGRERGDILFPEDGYVSGLHCRLSWDGRQAVPDRSRQLERHLRSPARGDRGPLAATCCSWASSSSAWRS